MGTETETWHDQKPTHRKQSKFVQYFDERLKLVMIEYNRVLDTDTSNMTASQKLDWWRDLVVPAGKLHDSVYADWLLAHEAEGRACDCYDKTCVVCRVEERYYELNKESE